MQDDVLQRRQFLSSMCGTLGLLGLAGDATALAAGEASGGRPVPADLQAAREKLLAEMEANRGIGVPRCDGDFLLLMVQLTDAKDVLEVGTFRGYSAIRMSIGLEQTGGRLTTIDIDPQRVQEATANFQKAGLVDRITALQGDAHQVAKTVAGPFDLVFLDAEKGGERDYFNTVFPKLRPGGVLLVHNAITSKTSMQSYLDMVAKHPEIIHVVLSLSMSDGFSVSFRKRVPGVAAGS
jgi:predicted O-methyltransferase YrrM